LLDAYRSVINAEGVAFNSHGRQAVDKIEMGDVSAEGATCKNFALP